MDLEFITSTKEPLNDSLNAARIAVETFYATTDAKTGLINVKRAEDASKANRAAENLSIDLQVKTVPELLEYLSHRDFNLRERVVALLKLRAVDSTAPLDMRNREFLIEQITAPAALVALFNCSTIDTHPSLQSDTLLLVSGLLNEPLKDKFRQVGCFPVLAALWDRHLEESLLQKVLSLTQELTTANEQNCMACKQTKRISEICYLFDPASKSPLSVANRQLAVGVLRNISKVIGAVDQIAKTGVHSHLFDLVNKLWRAPLQKGEQVPGKDAMLTQQILETLSNVALGRVLRSRMTPTQWQLVSNLLEPSKTLSKDWCKSRQPDQEFFISTCMQGQILQLLSRLVTINSYQPEDELDYQVSARRLLAQQLQVIDKCLAFLPPSTFSIPSDAMSYVLDTIFYLIKKDENNTERFLDLNGLVLVSVHVLRQPKLPEYRQHVGLNKRAIEIIHIASLGKLFGGNESTSSLSSVGQFVRPTLDYALQYPEDTPLILSVMAFLKDLASVPHHAAALPVDSFQYACHCIKTHAVADVIVVSVQFLTRACRHSENGKMVLRQTSVDMVPLLLSYLGNDNQEMQESIMTLLAEVFANDVTKTTGNGGMAIVTNSGLLILVALLKSQLSSMELKYQSLVVLDGLLKSYVGDGEELRRLYLASDVLPPVVSLLTSPHEPAQFASLTIVARLASHRASKMALEGMGVGDALSALHASSASDPNNKARMALHDRVSSIIPIFSGSIASYNQAADSISENASDATDHLLGQLSKWQLKQLVKLAMNKLPEMMEIVTDTIHANISNPAGMRSKKTDKNHQNSNNTSNNQKESKESKESYSASSPATPPPSSSAPSNSVPSSGGPPPPPPPSIGGLTSPPPPPPSGSSPSSSGTAKAPAKTVNSALSTTKAPAMGNFFDQLQAAVGSGSSSSSSQRLQMKKVADTTPLPNDKKAKKAKKEDPRVNTFFQGIKEAHPEGTRLIEQGTSNGKQFWVRDMGKFVEEVQKSFQLDFGFLKLLNHVIASTVSTLAFQTIHSTFVKEVSPERLAAQLINLGFSVKHNLLLLPGSDTPTTEYTAVIVPGDMPIQVIARTITWTVSQTHSLPSFSPSPSSSSIANASPNPSVAHGSAGSSEAEVKSSPSPSATASPASATSDSFECRLCKNSFPSSASTEIQGRLFCEPCSGVVLNALSKRTQ